MDDNTPVLVGVAAFQQHNPDYSAALEPIAIMEQALRDAADDAGNSSLLSRAGEVLVPKGIWGYSDPGRLLADAFGAGQARSVLAEIGVSQQTLLTRACQTITAGEAEVVLVTGAEAKYRALCSAKAGTEATETVQQDVEPDEKLLPEDELWSAVESAAGLGMPVGYYAIMDSALRYKQGLTPESHRQQMGEMYQRFSEIAAANPEAWSRAPVDAATISEPSPANRMLAFPYTKLHNSQWNVDQGAGLIFCSVALARELGLDPDKWIHPRAFAESNFMSVVSSRGDLGGCPGFRIAGATAMERAGISFEDIRLRELYSCFPLAVRSQLHEFGMSGDGDLSVTGGMTFGGGPLNNFVFQATVRMARLLRAQPAEVGLVTTVSGMLTKQGVALWSAQPGVDGWVFDDVTAQVREASDIREVVADVEGEAAVAGYTVMYQGGEPWRAVAIFDLADGRRTAAYSEQPAVIAAMLSRECCGEVFSLAAGEFRPRG
ncbi:acetyl-CoA acetyltransferase [Seongchinamella sediminis]|uniref:Acetyl-CoA acetyltransferase n=1 Tax=Seongchinamella sediminis TaxID=2283635 RepID=A0A3L7DXT2_9GAMM|nr:acetyl-CoA acetyltransferase [Seongchinamella sediminis]RLQ20801.1 acetyl-CoA acetyltransferase [Seongchinamella sediminis]